jgi:hypothetical protein
MPNAGCLDLPYVVKITTNASRHPDILLRPWMSMRLVRSNKNQYYEQLFGHGWQSSPGATGPCRRGLLTLYPPTA